MEIKHPSREEIPGLKRMWRDIFNDSYAYIDYFFDFKLKPENTFIIKDTAMLHSFPVSVRDGEKRLAAAYLCGIAVTPKKRGCGYASELIRYTLQVIKNRGYDLCFLIPASERLFNYYDKFGFKPFTYLHKQSFMREGSVSLPAHSERFDFPLLSSFYKGFAGRLYAERDADDFKHIFNCYAHTMIFNDGYLVYHIAKGILHIVEHTFSGETIREYANGLLTKHNLKRAQITSPCFGEDECCYPFTAARFFAEAPTIKKGDGYINLMLN